MKGLDRCEGGLSGERVRGVWVEKQACRCYAAVWESLNNRVCGGHGRADPTTTIRTCGATPAPEPPVSAVYGADQNSIGQQTSDNTQHHKHFTALITVVHWPHSTFTVLPSSLNDVGPIRHPARSHLFRRVHSARIRICRPFTVVLGRRLFMGFSLKRR